MEKFLLGNEKYLNTMLVKTPKPKSKFTVPITIGLGALKEIEKIVSNLYETRRNSSK